MKRFFIGLFFSFSVILILTLDFLLVFDQERDNFLALLSQVGQKFSKAGENENKASMTMLVVEEKREPDIYPLKKEIVADFQSEAKTFLVYDLDHERILCSKDGDQLLPIASLTKMMTAVLIFEAGNLDDWVKISPEALEKVANFSRLDANQEFLVRDLLAAMFISSNNEAAYELARYFSEINFNKKDTGKFMELMNEKAKEIGMTNTHFANPIGFDQKGNFSTAEDLVILTKFILEKYPYLFEISRKEEKTIFSKTEKPYMLRNTNHLLKVIPDIYGSKTGFTDQAQGCMLLIKNIGDARLLFLVLGAQFREEEMKKLIFWVEESYKF